MSGPSSWKSARTNRAHNRCDKQRDGSNVSLSSLSNHKVNTPSTFWTTALLMLSIFLIHSDQNLLAPNLTAAADDLGLAGPDERDAKLGGGLAIGMFLVGAPAALVIGAGSDEMLNFGGRVRIGRSDLVFLVLLIGAAGCAGSAMSRSYPQLFVARAVTGVSLAGGFPLSMSLLSDLHGPERRTQITGRLGVGMNLGVLAGQALSGWVGPKYGWRAPFRIVSVIMAAAACAVWKFLSEPDRVEAGASGDVKNEFSRSLMRDCNILEEVSDVPYKENYPKGTRSTPRHSSQLLRLPTFWLVMLQGVPGCVPWVR